MFCNLPAPSNDLGINGMACNLAIWELLISSIQNPYNAHIDFKTNDITWFMINVILADNAELITWFRELSSIKILSTSIFWRADEDFVPTSNAKWMKARYVIIHEKRDRFWLRIFDILGRVFKRGKTNVLSLTPLYLLVNIMESIWSSNIFIPLVFSFLMWWVTKSSVARIAFLVAMPILVCDKISYSL